MSDGPHDRLLTIREVAQRLGVTTRTVASLAPPKIRLSARTDRYPEAELNAWLARRMTS